MTEDAPTNMLDLADDGRVRIVTNDATFMLKVPKVKEYRTLRSSYSEAVNRYDDDRAAATDGIEDATEKRDKLRSFNLSDYLGPVAVEIIATLNGAEPDAEDLPVWLTDATDALNAIFTHWRTVPLARGGKVPPH